MILDGQKFGYAMLHALLFTWLVTIYLLFFLTKCAYYTTFSLCPLESVYYITGWGYSMILKLPQM